MFSKRTAWNLQPSLLSQAWEERQRAGRKADHTAGQEAGRDCYDLTASNPTVAGFAVDLAGVAASLAEAAGAAYGPVPFGLPAAREAVAGYYREQHGLAVAAERVLLTVSTSEAYSYLFRLLCDPGDEVLYLQPGYPLFDYLAELDSVRLRPLSWLQDADGWHLDRGGLQQSLNERTRAVLLVHPNNPTGHFTSAADRQWLDGWAAANGLAVIVDEVFLDYPLAGTLSDAETLGAERSDAERSFLAGPASAATFVLSGISKICGLPQMKVGWIVLHGPAGLLAEAAERLEVIADTFLSVSTPLQLALTSLLQVREQVQPQIVERLRGNLQLLDRLLAGQPMVRRLPVGGGWYACLRVPAHEEAEAAAVRLLQQTGVYLHPGSFFGFDEEGVWVVSLLTVPAVFEAGVRRLLGYAKNLE